MRDPGDHTDANAVLGRADYRALPMDSLAAFNEDLNSKIASLDPKASSAGGLALIAKHSLRDAVVFADRFLSLPEILNPSELARHPDRLDGRQVAAVLLHENSSALTAEELGRSVAHGRLVINASAIHNAKDAKALATHPDLKSAERRFACLVAAAEASDVSAHPQMASTLFKWLSHRLCETPYAEGAARLAELHRKGKITADAVGATGDRALLEEFAPTNMACAFALDPKTAFDRFGALLVETTPLPNGLFALLSVLAQDGFSTHGLAGKRSNAPQGWVRADPRWIAPLMALRESSNPNLSIPAGTALGNADVEKVLDLLPKPKKKIPELKIELLGSIDGHGDARLWLGEGRVVVADDQGLAAYSLAKGLPEACKITLPEGVKIHSEGSSAHDHPWEAPGIYDVAVRADGAIAIGAQSTSGTHLIALYDAKGVSIALREFGEKDALFPHALIFGAGGKGSLWAAQVDDESHVACAYSPKDLTPKSRVKLGNDYPAPAHFMTTTHPTEDVAIFEVACGQDGSWLPIVDAGAKPRKHKLTSKQNVIAFVGVDSSNAAFAYDRRLSLRPWPDLESPKKKRLDGSVVGAAVIDEGIVLALAEVSNDPSAIELRRFKDGERIGKSRYPLGERFRALGAGVLVTSSHESLRVYRIGG